MKILTKETRRLIGQNWYNIFLFELLYRGLTGPLYLRLANRGLQFALQMAGYSYLTVENLRGFFLQPWTWVMLVIISVAGILRMTVEIAGLLTAYQGSASFHKLTPFPILWGALQKTVRLILNRNWFLGVILILDGLVINLLYLGRMIMHVKPVSFIAQEMCREPQWILPAAAGIVLLVIAAFPTAFVSFECMIGNRQFVRGMHGSARIVRKHWKNLFLELLFVNLAMAAAAFLLYALSFVAAAVFVTVFTRRTLAMAVLQIVTDRLEIILLTAMSTAATVVNYALLSVFYKEYGENGYRAAVTGTDGLHRSNPGYRKIAIGITVVIGMSLFYIFTLVRNGFSVTDGLLTQTEITAHRGSSRKAPENTLAAFEAAMEELADMAELDVQLTADGEVVLGHDSTLKRVAGINRSISSMTWEELQHVDVGSWFSEAYAGETVPRLADVMEYCKGRLDLNIELKNIGKNSELPDKVVDLIHEYAMEEQCVITSTSMSYLRRIKQLAPELRTGYIIAAAYGDFYSGEDVDFISIRSGFVNSSLMEQVHEQGKAVHAWTVNSKSEIERLCLLGVDNIITDYPAMVREIAYRDEATETLMEYLRLIFR